MKGSIQGTLEQLRNFRNSQYGEVVDKFLGWLKEQYGISPAWDEFYADVYTVGQINMVWGELQGHISKGHISSEKIGTLFVDEGRYLVLVLVNPSASEAIYAHDACQVLYESSDTEVISTEIDGNQLLAIRIFID